MIDGDKPISPWVRIGGMIFCLSGLVSVGIAYFYVGWDALVLGCNILGVIFFGAWLIAAARVNPPIKGWGVWMMAVYFLLNLASLIARVA